MTLMAYADLLGEAMQWGVDLSRYWQLSPAAAQCLAESQCNTTNRVSMWCAQTGHESAGLLYMEEIADGSAYEGREDLGNVYPGDGCLFKGRGPIQLTGRYNYTECSRWAFERGLVPTPTFFVDFPHEMAGDVYGFMGVTWYWTVSRDMNSYADAGDIVGASYAVNGGDHGLADREQRWYHCLGIGERIMGLTDQNAATPPPPVEKVLNYDHSLVGQQTGWNCGPASAQVALSCRGIFVEESVLAAECGTHTGGTDYVGLIENCLDPRLPEANYTSVDAPNDPPTPDQVERLWDGIMRSIDSGYAAILNWVAPPGNYPVGIKGSQSPNYGGGTVFHYVSAVGYDSNPAQRAVCIADSGFQPPQYWVSLNQCATLIPPKAACYANLQPPPPEGSTVDYNKLGYEQFCGPVDPATGYGVGWPQLGQNATGQNLYLVDALSDILHLLEGGAVQDHAHVAPAANAAPDYDKLAYEQQVGVNGTGWPQLGGRTIVDAIAHIKSVLWGGGTPPFRQTPKGEEGSPRRGTHS